MDDDKDDKIDLPHLTDKQFDFVLGKQKGLSNTDAYRQAYDTTATGNPLWVMAARVADNPKVKLWLEHMNQERMTAQVTEATYTKERHLQDMAEAARLCREKGQLSAMVKATENLGKCAGHYVDKVEHIHNSKADSELLDQVEKTFGKPARVEAERRLGINQTMESLTKH